MSTILFDMTFALWWSLKLRTDYSQTLTPKQNHCRETIVLHLFQQTVNRFYLSWSVLLFTLLNKWDTMKVLKEFSFCELVLSVVFVINRLSFIKLFFHCHFWVAFCSFYKVLKFKYFSSKEYAFIYSGTSF